MIAIRCSEISDIRVSEVLPGKSIDVDLL